jgi:hypothetical protein
MSAYHHSLNPLRPPYILNLGKSIENLGISLANLSVPLPLMYVLHLNLVFLVPFFFFILRSDLLREVAEVLLQPVKDHLVKLLVLIFPKLL